MYESSFLIWIYNIYMLQYQVEHQVGLVGLDNIWIWLSQTW